MHALGVSPECHAPNWNVGVRTHPENPIIFRQFDRVSSRTGNTNEACFRANRWGVSVGWPHRKQHFVCRSQQQFEGFAATIRTLRLAPQPASSGAGASRLGVCSVMPTVTDPQHARGTVAAEHAGSSGDAWLRESTKAARRQTVIKAWIFQAVLSRAWRKR